MARKSHCSSIRPMSVPVLLPSAAASCEAHVPLGLLGRPQSSHSSPRPSGESRGMGTQPHDLSAKGSMSSADLLLFGLFHSGSHRKKSIPDTPEAAASPWNIFPKGFRAFPSYFCTNWATTLGAGGLPLASSGWQARRRTGRLVCTGSSSPAARRLRHPPG